MRTLGIRGRFLSGAQLLVASFVHVSRAPVYVPGPHGTVKTVWPKGTTFKAGRNAEKRATRGNPIGRAVALANRRMRQRGEA